MYVARAASWLFVWVQAEIERSKREADYLLSRLDKAQKDYEQMVMNNNQLAGENVQRMAELKAKDEEIGGLKKELARVSKIREALQRKLRQTEEQKMESEQRRESLRQQIQGMERGQCLGKMLRTYCMLAYG